MPADPTYPADAGSDWSGDFLSAERRQLELWASATPAERLRWLEEAIDFAWRMGALPDKSKGSADDLGRRR